MSYMFFFFFSSRRRHTRFDCDWSSDVCSSDLAGGGADLVVLALGGEALVNCVSPNSTNVAAWPVAVPSRLLTCTFSAAMPHSLRSRLKGVVWMVLSALKSTMSPVLANVTGVVESTNVAETAGLP